MGYVDTLSDLEDHGDGSKPCADFVFDLVDVETKKPAIGSGLRKIAFEMRGAYANGDVGIHVSLDPESWTVADRTDFLVTYGGVTLMSSGACSDRLVRLYEAWWGLPVGTRPAASAISVAAAGINCHPANALSGRMHLKLFFEPAREWESEEEPDPFYGELYLNFDLKARRGWLKEKDEEYRKQVAGWLTGELHADSP